MNRIHRHHPRTRLHRRGTTLLEVLVVIVVFLVGILAVVQIFPRGFQILLQNRSDSLAATLAKAESERLKTSTDSLPEMIVAVRSVGGALVIDPDRTPNDLGPAGTSLNVNGVLSDSSGTVGDWTRFSGANLFRRVIGEGGTVPGPTRIGSQFGGLVVLQFGPLSDLGSIYGNDLLRQVGVPSGLDRRDAGSYYVSGDGSAVTLSLPSGPTDRVYRVVLSAYVGSGASMRKLDFAQLPPVNVPASTPDASGLYPLYNQPVSGLVAGLAGVDVESIRVRREFRKLSLADAFSDGQAGRALDPYEVKVLDGSLGVLLFNPAASAERVVLADRREPLTARVDYTVRDWRILREEIRFGDGPTPSVKLALNSLRVSGQGGADGRPNTDAEFQTATAGTTNQNPKADLFLLVDLATGGLVNEMNGATPVLQVNKSQGLVQVTDIDPNTPGVQAQVILPTGETQVVNLTGRALRALYSSADEWAVQVLKAASSYGVTLGTPAPGQFYVGGTGTLAGSATRIYFPRMDAGRKVVVGQLRYLYDDGGTTRVGVLNGQDFTIAFRPGADSIGAPLPSIDLRDVVPGATGFDFSTGSPAERVEGASVLVRSLRNPAKFGLTDNATRNMTALEQWGREWRRRSVETYLRKGGEAR